MSEIDTVSHTGFSTKLAIGSLIIGTLLFLSYELFPNHSLIMAGLIYVLIAILLNTIILFHLLYELVVLPNKEETLIRVLIVISNIPIACFYLSIILH